MPKRNKTCAIFDVLKYLVEACETADRLGELSEYIAGDVLDDARAVIRAKGSEKISETRHTPGPWELERSCKTAINAGVKHIAMVNHYNAGRDDLRTIAGEEHNANACLISAAPELFAACKEFVRKCECGEARSIRSYAQMKDAISKAEGGE